MTHAEAYKAILLRAAENPEAAKAFCEAAFFFCTSTEEKSFNDTPSDIEGTRFTQIKQILDKVGVDYIPDNDWEEFYLTLTKPKQ